MLPYTATATQSVDVPSCAAPISNTLHVVLNVHRLFLHSSLSYSSTATLEKLEEHQHLGGGLLSVAEADDRRLTTEERKRFDAHSLYDHCFVAGGDFDDGEIW